MNAEHTKNIADFFREDHQRMVAYVRQWFRDVSYADAEDIVQDVMLSVFNAADVTRPVNNLAAYIYRSLRNRTIDMYRSQKNDDSLDRVVGESPSDTLGSLIEDIRYAAHDRAGRNELQAHLIEAIEKLPAPLRAIVTAVELEGKSYQELSLLWGTPIGTLLARKHRAMNKLHTALSKYLSH